MCVCARTCVSMRIWVPARICAYARTCADRWKAKQRCVLDIGREGLQCVRPGLAKYVEAVMRQYQQQLDGQGIVAHVDDEQYKAALANAVGLGKWVPKLRQNEAEWYRFLALDDWRRTLVLFQQFPEAVLEEVSDMDVTALCSILVCDAFKDETVMAKVTAIAAEDGIVKLTVERSDDDGSVSITSAFSDVTRADESVPIAVGEMVEIPIRPHLRALRDVRPPDHAPCLHVQRV